MKTRSDEWFKEINQGERETKNTYKFPTVRFPSRDLVLAGHRQMDRIHHHTVPRRLCGSRGRRYAVRRVQQTLVIA